MQMDTLFICSTHIYFFPGQARWAGTRTISRCGFTCGVIRYCSPCHPVPILSSRALAGRQYYRN